MKFNDGIISNDLMIFRNGRTLADVSCGFSIVSPALQNAPLSFLAQQEAELRAFLQNLAPNERLQIRWSQDGDFSGPLKSYYEDTERLADSEWSRHQRNAKFVFNTELQEDGRLRSEKVSLFLLKKNVELGRAEKDQTNSLESVGNSFQLHERSLRDMVKRLGGESARLSNSELFEESYRHFNPLAKPPSSDFFETSLRPESSVLDNCLDGDLVAVTGLPHCFYNSGCFHGYLALSAPPLNTFSGLIAQLTSLSERKFALVVNIEALDVAKEIEKAESSVTKLRRAARSHPKATMLQQIEEAEQRVRRLTSREQSPMKVQVLIHVWAESAEELQHKLASLRVGCQLMQGAKAYEVALPTMNRNLHLAAMPGASFREDSFWLKVGDHNVANLLPFVGDSADSLKGAHALYHGWQGNLVGLKIFKGEPGHESPQLALTTGKAGGGKSAFLVDALTQTAPHIDFGVIIDEGNSHGAFLEVNSNRESRTFAVDVNGGESLNYLSTGGLPLSPFHLTDVVSIARCMAGERQDEDANNRRHAVLSRVFHEFYGSWFESWKAKNPEKMVEVTQALAAIRYYQNLFKKDEALAESWSDFEEWQKSGPEELNSHSEASRIQLERLSENPDDPELVFLAYAFMEREEYPVHSNLHDFLEEYEKRAERDHDEVTALVTLLEPWRADRGTRGRLFDGHSTIDFSAKYVHIELGRMQDADPTLKALVSRVVSGTIRNEIMRRSRAEKKLLIIEELGAFLTIKGGKELVQDMYQRMRKHNTWVCSVIQQISSLPLDLARSVVGNCRQAYLFRQKEERDLEALQKAFDLPDSIIELMKQFPDPSKERGAPFILWEDLGGKTRATPCFNHVSPEMLYVAGSSGTHFEMRKQKLAAYESAFKGVLNEAVKLKGE